MAKGQTGQQRAAVQRKADEISERRRQCYHLWSNDKKSLREIGEQLGVAHETVRNDLRAVQDKLLDEFHEEIRDQRAKQLRRLNAQYERFDKIASSTAESSADRVKAGGLCRQVVNDISDLLNLKAPQKHEHTGSIEIATRVIEPGE